MDKTPTNTAIMAIVVDRDSDTGYWHFDDPARGLEREALIRGADKILDTIRMDEAIMGPRIASKLILTFSAQKFPGSQYAFERKEAEDSGNWYYWPQGDMRGWLCPALLLYFREAPEVLHMQVAVHPDSEMAELALTDLSTVRLMQQLERRLASCDRMTIAEMEDWSKRIKEALKATELL